RLHVGVGDLGIGTTYVQKGHLRCSVRRRVARGKLSDLGWNEPEPGIANGFSREVALGKTKPGDQDGGVHGLLSSAWRRMGQLTARRPVTVHSLLPGESKCPR